MSWSACLSPQATQEVCDNGVWCGVGWCAVLQEQYDQLQRQLQHVTAWEAGLQAEVEACQLEHSQLLAANTQLIAQCAGLNKEVQVRLAGSTVGSSEDISSTGGCMAQRAWVVKQF